MVSYYLVHYNSQKKAVELCDLLDPQNKPLCLTYVKELGDSIRIPEGKIESNVQGIYNRRELFNFSH